MQQFFKFFFASCLGTIIGLLLLIFVLFWIGSSVATSFSEEEETQVDANSVLKMSLDYSIPERTSENPFENIDFSNFKPSQNLGLPDILDNIEKAASDENIKGIYLEMDGMPNSLATIEAVRQKLQTFRDSGKFVIAYGEIITQKGYYLASVADEVYLNPKGLLQLNGFNTSIAFFKNTLRKLDVEVQIFYAGKFKSATEPFRRRDMSQANRKQLTAYLDEIYGQLINRIAQSRNMAKKEVDSIIDNLVVRHPHSAKANNIVDDLFYEDQVHDRLREKTGLDSDEEVSFVTNKEYDNVPGQNEVKGLVDDKIAVLYASGSIVGGEGDQGQIGSEKFAGSIRNIRENDEIKALVLRINSPGGSALASEVIWREIHLARQKMPVIVSMGGVAASGGYYMASAGDTIMAEANTVTGSIGVFGLLPNMKGFFNNKLGVTFDGVKTSKFADFGQLTRPLRPEEEAIIQSGIDTVYRSFKKRVAEGRSLSMDSVQALAQGRIYSGTQAKNNGLVDLLGGLEDAIALAKNKANLDEFRVRSYPKQEDPFEKFLDKMKGGVHTLWMKQKLGNYFEYYEQLDQLREMNGIQARMPYDLEVN